jgi:Carboxypeptidase regulatory-like domain
MALYTERIMCGETGLLSFPGAPLRSRSLAQTLAQTLPKMRQMRRGALGLVLGCSVLSAGHAAMAQRGPVDRIVEGKVTDKSETPVKGAVVYLKNDHSLAVKSFIVDDVGYYRFGQLAQSTDYELWAELNGKKSSTRVISSFDNKNAFVLNLKIDTGK